MKHKTTPEFKEILKKSDSVFIYANSVGLWVQITKKQVERMIRTMPHRVWEAHLLHHNNLYMG